MRTVVFINSQSRQSRRVIDRLKADLADSQFNIVAFIKIGPFRRFSTGLQNLRQQKNIECIIIAGGDGTIAGVVNVLLKRKVKVGLLPLGTGNSFTRSLGIPLDYEGALTVIKAGVTTQASLGSVNGQVFINAAAIGLSAVSAAQISDRSKRYLGRLSYALSGGKHLLRHRAFACEIKTARKIYNFRSHELLIMNGRFHGGKQVDHHTTVHKNYLTFTAIGTNKSRWNYLKSQWHIRRGRQVTENHLFNVSAAQATVTTTPRRHVHADGEIITRTPAAFKIKPKAITVFVPN